MSILVSPEEFDSLAKELPRLNVVQIKQSLLRPGAQHELKVFLKDLFGRKGVRTEGWGLQNAKSMNDLAESLQKGEYLIAEQDDESEPLFLWGWRISLRIFSAREGIPCRLFSILEHHGGIAPEFIFLSFMMKDGETFRQSVNGYLGKLFGPVSFRVLGIVFHKRKRILSEEGEKYFPNLHVEADSFFIFLEIDKFHPAPAGYVWRDEKKSY